MDPFGASFQTDPYFDDFSLMMEGKGGLNPVARSRSLSPYKKEFKVKTERIQGRDRKIQQNSDFIKAKVHTQEESNGEP